MEGIGYDPTSIDESARRRFEADWQRDEAGPIEDYLREPQDPTYQATLEELIHIELELAQRRAAPEATVMRVEGYLERFPELDDDPRRVQRLLEQEYYVRHRFGDRPSADEYRQRFPELVESAGDIDTILRSRQAAEPPAVKQPTLQIPIRVELPDESDPGRRGPAAPSDDAPLEQKGRYLIESEIGRGGMGVVYRAFDRDLRRRVAMKVLQQHFTRHQEVVDRFVEEAQSTAQLQHPGIVPVYEIGLDESRQLFFTMKLVRGQTLDEVIEELRNGDPGDRKAGRTRLLRLFVDIARTVFYAHERGVVHRDLKPQNVMIGTYDEIQVMDWGLAKVLTRGRGDSIAISQDRRLDLSSQRDDTQVGAVLGTPAYMAPEQAGENQAAIGPAADLYALGAILYHLLTGRPPFSGASTDEVLEKVRSQPPKAPRRLDPDVPPALEAVCLKALDRDPDLRYRSAAELADEVEAFLEHRPVRAYQERGLEGVVRLARRYQKVTVTMGVALLLMFIGSAFFNVRLNKHWHDAEAARQAEEEERQRAEDNERKALEARAREVEARTLAEQRERLAYAGMLAAREHLVESATVLRTLRDEAAESLRPEVVGLLKELTPGLQTGFRERLLLAERDFRHGRVEAAVEKLEEARGWLPRRYEPFFYRAWMLARDQRHDEALAALEQALELEGASEEAIVGCRDFDRLRQDGRFIELVARHYGPEAAARAERPWRTGWAGEKLPEGIGRGAPGSYWWDTGELLLEVVYVPPGGFIMGSDSEQSDDDEAPRHTHMIPYGYYIGRYEVSWQEYRRYCLATGNNLPDTEGREVPDDYPALGITWYEARDFCRWAGGRLPSEAEWEKAARGTDGRRYPWGNEGPTGARCVWDGHPQHGNLSPAPVGTAWQGASPYGAYNMAGNVTEWCADWYEPQAYERYSDGDLAAPLQGADRIRRGGSWGTTAGWCRTSYRGRRPPGRRSVHQGFRPVLPGQ